MSEVAEHDPGGEEDDRGDQQRPDEAPLALRQPRRHEAPDLEEDHRHGQRDAGDSAILMLDAERLADRVW